ncbi:MAG: pitrilysin family protein [bacterium]|jgi:predicted Zn-dependent peptidase
MASILVEQITLDNGLRVNLSPDSNTPIVTVNLWYGVGSRNERPGKTGFAHLFEHMMFEGSLNIPKGVHWELVERAGGSMNASTWFDRTNYFETLPSHHLELALWLESDRMGWMLPAITEEKLDNQRNVVMNEKRQRYDNQPYGDWGEKIQAMVYPKSHPYHHTVIGSMEDIEGSTLEDVSDFFKTFYVPNNAVLTVCGDFDPAAGLELIQKHFGDIPKGGAIPEIPGEPELARLIGETKRDHVEGDVPLPRVIMAFRIPSYTEQGFYPADVASSILGSGRSSRLYNSLVRKKRIAKDVASFVFPLTTGAGMLMVWATGLPDGSVDDLETALSEEIEKMNSVRTEEISRVIALTETSFIRQIEQVGERADLLSMFSQFFDDPHRLNSEIERLCSVSSGDVENFTSEFLGEDNRAVLTYMPGGDS